LRHAAEREHRSDPALLRRVQRVAVFVLMDAPGLSAQHKHPPPRRVFSTTPRAPKTFGLGGDVRHTVIEARRSPRPSPVGRARTACALPCPWGWFIQLSRGAAGIS
ncbi:hypothetical protein STRTUCAR8_03982, partial [Streptomyces turgidiscabies Car8]